MKRSLAVALPILAVLLYASLSHVPGGSVGVRKRGEAFEVLKPGFHIHRPFAPAPAIYSLSLPSVGDEIRITLADGANYRVGFDITGKIDPERAAAFHAMALKSGSDALLKEVGARSLAGAAAARPSVDLASGALETEAARRAGTALSPFGLLEVSLKLRPLGGPECLRLGQALAGARLAGALRPAVTQILSSGKAGWEAHAAMGLVLESEKDIHGAEKEYLDALTLSPAAIAPMAQLVAIYSAVGEHKKLDRLLEAGIQAQPTSVQHLAWYAMSMLNQNRLKEAGQTTERALALDPGNVLLLNDLGVVQAKEGRMDEAIATFRKAIEASPHDRQSLYNIGVALSTQNKDKEALPYLLESEKVASPGAALLNAIAHAYRRTGDARRAAEYQHRATQVQPRPSPGS
jgi:tetratricopeptide (TPR) repeat protein